METFTAFEYAVASTAEIIKEVRPGQGTTPTPCAEWDVRSLLNHVIGTLWLAEALFTGQAPRILARSRRVMDRAGPDHHHQPVIHAVQDPVHGVARVMHGLRGPVGARELADQVGRGRQLLDLLDPEIVGHVSHALAPSVFHDRIHW